MNESYKIAAMSFVLSSEALKTRIMSCSHVNEW